MVILSSCSSTQKAAQTPDDIYYSPGASKTIAASQGGEQPEYYSTAPSDQYVRMKVQDPARWSYFDDYNAYDSYYAPSAVSPYFGVGYGMGYGLGYGMSAFSLGFGDPYMCWNSYYMWNSWYNPYFYNPYYGGGVIIVNPKLPPTTVYNHLRTFNGSSYNNGFVRSGTGTVRPYRNTTNTYNPYRSGNGNTYRPANANNSGFMNNNRPTYNTNSQPVRSYSPPPSSFGGGGGGGFSRPGRH
jgi:hypothetical protein